MTGGVRILSSRGSATYAFHREPEQPTDALPCRAEEVIGAEEPPTAWANSSERCVERPPTFVTRRTDRRMLQYGHERVSARARALADAPYQARFAPTVNRTPELPIMSSVKMCVTLASRALSASGPLTR